MCSAVINDAKERHRVSRTLRPMTDWRDTYGHLVYVIWWPQLQSVL